MDEGAHLCSVVDRFLFYTNRRLTVDSDKGFARQCSDLDKRAYQLGKSVCDFLESYNKSAPDQAKGGQAQDDFKHARAVVCQLAQLACIEGNVACWRAVGPPPVPPPPPSSSSSSAQVSSVSSASQSSSQPFSQPLASLPQVSRPCSPPRIVFSRLHPASFVLTFSQQRQQ